MLSAHPICTPAVFSHNTISSVTGTTSETTLATVTIPAGFILKNAVVEVWTLFQVTNSANNKTLRLKFGTSNAFTFAVTATRSIHRFTNVYFRNSLSSQRQHANGNNLGLGTVAATSSMSVDYSVNQTISWTGTLVDTTETISLYGGLVIIWNYE